MGRGACGGRARRWGRPRSAGFARGAVDRYHLVNNFFITTTITRSDIIFKTFFFRPPVQISNRVLKRKKRPVTRKPIGCGAAQTQPGRKRDALRLDTSRCPYFIISHIDSCSFCLIIDWGHDFWRFFNRSLSLQHESGQFWENFAWEDAKYLSMYICPVVHSIK